jgi:hypothetical protein
MNENQRIIIVLFLILLSIATWVYFLHVPKNVENIYDDEHIDAEMEIIELLFSLNMYDDFNKEASINYPNLDYNLNIMGVNKNEKFK